MWELWGRRLGVDTTEVLELHPVTSYDHCRVIVEEGRLLQLSGMLP